MPLLFCSLLLAVGQVQVGVSQESTQDLMGRVTSSLYDYNYRAESIRHELHDRVIFSEGHADTLSILQSATPNVLIPPRNRISLQNMLLRSGRCTSAVCGGHLAMPLSAWPPPTDRGESGRGRAIPGTTETVQTIGPLTLNLYSFAPVVFLGRYHRAGGACSGVRVGKGTFVTAAHCVCANGDVLPFQFAFFGSSLALGKPGLGYQFSRTLQDTAKTRAEEFCRAYEHDPTSAWSLGDLAILTLKFPLGYDDSIATIPSNTSHSIEGFMVSGFGRSSISDIGGRKYFAGVNVDSCSRPDLACLSGEPEFIAFGENGVDTCAGDSGGGVFAQTASGEMLLVGVTSRATDHAIPHECGRGGTYVSLLFEPTRNWIYSNLN